MFYITLVKFTLVPWGALMHSLGTAVVDYLRVGASALSWGPALRSDRLSASGGCPYLPWKRSGFLGTASLTQSRWRICAGQIWLNNSLILLHSKFSLFWIFEISRFKDLETEDCLGSLFPGNLLFPTSFRTSRSLPAPLCGQHCRLQSYILFIDHVS